MLLLLLVRLLSPPAKMLRAFVFPACDLVLKTLLTPEELKGGLEPRLPVGLTVFNVGTRVKAAMSDDADVDLSRGSR